MPINTKEDALFDQLSELDIDLMNLNHVLNTYNGLIFLWRPKSLKEENRIPEILGSPIAIAHFLRFIEDEHATNPAVYIFEHLKSMPAETEKGEQVSFETLFLSLINEGESFLCVLTAETGEKILTKGITAGLQIVVWVSEIFTFDKNQLFDYDQLKSLQQTHGDSALLTHKFFDQSGLCFWLTDLKGKLVWANSDYIRSVGGEGLAEVLKKQIILLPETQEFIKPLAENKCTQCNQSFYVSINGKRCYLDCLAVKDQSFIFFLAIDRTEEQLSKKEILNYKKTHDAVLNSLNEAALVFDSNKKLRFYNHSFVKMFDFQEQDLDHHIFHGDLLDRLREARFLPDQEHYEQWKLSQLNRYETVQENSEEDELWNLPDGRMLKITHMLYPMGGLLLLFDDITNQINLEARYNTLIKVQTATLDKLNEGIAVFKSDGCLKLYNKSLLEVWRVENNEFHEGMDFDVFAKICSKYYYQSEFWQNLKVRITDPNPEIRQHISGEIQTSDDRFLSYFSRPLPDGATILSWDDITQTRQVEHVLRERAEALEEAGRIKSNFIGHMSYHLRSPLQTILGYSDILLNKKQLMCEENQNELQKAEALRPLLSIQEATQTLTKIIDDIFDIAAIEADAMEIELELVNLYDLLKDSLSYVTTRVEQSCIMFVLECDKNIGKVYADQKRLKQIVHNLLLNAVSFMPAHREGKIILGAERKKGEFCFWVRDTGIGISTEKQGKIFESFVSEQGGVGLGLSLVRHFVELHKGWVEFESEAGEGACIICHFPDRSIKQIEPLQKSNLL